MEKPTLESFGLTEQRYHAVKSFHDKLSVAILASPLVGTIVWYCDAVANKASGVPFGLLGCIFIGGLLGLGPTVLIFSILHRPVDSIFRLLSPEFRAAKAFDESTREYEAWNLRKEKEFWLTLSGIAFETELARLFSRAGRHARVTHASADEGVDIWLEEPDGKIIVQCKAHRRPVGPSVVRELYGTLQHFGANKAVLASLSGFTTGVRTYVRGKPIELMDLDDIIILQRSLVSGYRITQKGTRRRHSGL